MNYDDKLIVTSPIQKVHKDLLTVVTQSPAGFKCRVVYY